jgi:hypothetical protein
MVKKGHVVVLHEKMDNRTIFQSAEEHEKSGRLTGKNGHVIVLHEKRIHHQSVEEYRCD